MLQKTRKRAEFLSHGRLYAIPPLFRWRGPDAEEQQQRNWLSCGTPARWHPRVSPKDAMLLQLCCKGSTERRGQTRLCPPASHKHDILRGNVKCIMRTDRNVIAHRECFHPLTRNKTHVRSQKAVFALTNSAGCCLAVQDLPAPPKAFLMPRKQHFMKILPSLSLSEWFVLVTQA